MKPRSAKSRTADLFAETREYRPPASKPAPAASLPPPPAAQPDSRPHSKQLWYAAVFPELAQSDPAALQRLCLHALQFTSFVSMEPPNALLLEIKGSVKLFGSLERLHADLAACWGRLALNVLSATAPSTLAALWLARAGDPQQVVEVVDAAMLPGRLAKVPIACTAWESGQLQTLRAMGITSLGELLRLPRAGLARRLSPARVQDLDIALARSLAPRRAWVAREPFRERCDFETEIEHVPYLEKALEPLIERCAQFLRRRQAGVQALELRLKHREGPATRLRLGLASITSERRRLTDVLCQKLARLTLEAPVRGMELISGPLRGLSASSLDAFAGGLTGAVRDSAPQLVERLRARLGEKAVYGVCLIPEHRPEAAWRRVHELQLNAAPGLSGGMVEQEMPRPLWLLDEPLPLSPPEILQGPERIESGWWDGKGVARDYYVARQHVDARHSSGARLWVFQERQSKRWYVHGVFA